MKFIFYSFIILSVTLNFFTANTTTNKNFHQINLAAATLENNHPQNKTNGDVIVGESNWLFIARNDIKCFLGEDSLSAGHLIVIAKELKRRQELYAKKGIKLYFAISRFRIITKRQL